ncbi:BTAD domain-containing putative transcriptional regulator [Dactylosporangium sp. NPDC049140]|uniref:AfsR/SARP family transcriptional regulator n=1 Tax=Dactylosporangium sp. NPDC049140 TaxID=3155647 RepID=UPI0033C131C0
MLEYRILGPVEVVTDAGPIPLGGSKPRLLLGALLAERGRTVPPDRLVDAVWSEAPPPTARALVQTYVSQLRRALRPHGAEPAIVTTAAGYRVQPPDGALDHEAFTRLARAGRQAMAEERPAEAVDAFDRALGLWRGAAFGGTDNRYFHGTVAYLDELRLDVLEERGSAALATGRLDDLAGELVPLVARYPARERFLAQLMTVLYRLGRRADALAAFLAGRAVLLDELGIEPGAMLAATHLAILRDDAGVLGSLRPVRGRSLPAQPPAVPAGSGRGRSRPAQLPAVPAGSGRRPDAPARARPVQLPAVPADFTGRDRELEAIVAGLTAARPVPAVPIHVVTGAVGSGKTTLANRAAHAVAAHYPDGQLHVELRGGTDAPADPADVLSRLLRALGDDPSDAGSDPAVRLRERLAGRRLLLVLDDARDNDQLAPLLPGAPTCAVLITSRYRRVGPPGAGRTEIGAFDPDTSRLFLERIVGAERLSAEPEAAAAIVAACGGLPLALRPAGERLAAHPGWPLAALAGRLADSNRRLHELAGRPADGNRRLDELAGRPADGNRRLDEPTDDGRREPPDGDRRLGEPADEDQRLDEPAGGGPDVRAALQRAYRTLDRDARRALGRLATLGRPDVPSWALAPLLGVPARAAEEIVARLVDAHLLDLAGHDPAGRPRFGMHELTRLFAAERYRAETAQSRPVARYSRATARMQ